MTDTQHYDAIVIGSGQGGGPLSTALVASGRRTALIERDKIGGTCINTGCTPTKTMVASARVAYLAKRAPEYGIHDGAVRSDLTEIRERKREIVTSFREGSTSKIKAGGVDIIHGSARFTAPHALEIRLCDGGTEQVSADLIVIDTGTRPAVPPLPGLEDVPYLNSTTIMELDELPSHLLVLGGGYVGLEFAQMFRRFGSEVTIIQLGPELFGREDPDIAEAVATILREDGIEILLKTAAQRVERRDGTIHLAVHGPDGDRTLTGSHLLVAVGRVPNTEDLNLAAAGIETTDKGYVKVNERLESTAPGVYTVGDVAGGPAFTHISYDDFRILRTNLIQGGNRTTRDRLVPYVAFIDPQLGRVGLTEEQARKEGRNILVGTIPMSDVARANEVGETRGMVKVVVDAESRQILGCAVLGIEGGEVMAMIEIAMMGKLPYTALRDGIFAHPTLSELLNTLFESVKPPRQG
jgi:pyruvate/2-oxoglutarate dehydrogenase complex dihydrolipoamide dehydrogenase (E3) component